MKKPLISIIIPAKNEENYLPRSLEQFKGFKKLLGIEIIVAEGYSSDKTVSIARRFADKVIVEKDKHTIGYARNLGASLARGDILVFLDADILLDDVKGFVDRVLLTFKQSDVVAATAAVYVYPEQQTRLDFITHKFLNLTAKFSKGSRGECQVVRSSAFRKIKGYDPSLVASEDWDLFRRIRALGKVCYLEDVKVYESPRRFRKHGYLKVFYLYFLNYVSYLLFKRAYTREWVAVR